MWNACKTRVASEIDGNDVLGSLTGDNQEETLACTVVQIKQYLIDKFPSDRE